MAITSDFIDAVSQQKITRVRIMLKDSLLLDSSAEDFNKMFEYAKSNISSLMDEHDGEIFLTADKWTEEYLNEQMVAVVNNFSLERIELLKNMVQKLYKRSDDNNSTHTFDGHGSETSSQSSASSISSIQVAGATVAAVGTVALVGGLIAETSIVVPIVGGAAIVAGGAMIIFGKK